MTGARRGRLAALAMSAGVALAVLLGASSGAPSAAAPSGDCPTPTLLPSDPCPTSTSVDDTSTSIEETTTSFEETTTTFTQTTTREPTATTQEEVETTTSTSVDVATSNNILVPGDGTAGAESTTTTTEVPTTVSDDGTSDGVLLAVVIGGLVVLAIVVGVLTWRYWAATRPPAAPAVGSDDG